MTVSDDGSFAKPYFLCPRFAESRLLPACAWNATCVGGRGVEFPAMLAMTCVLCWLLV